MQELTLKMMGKWPEWDQTNYTAEAYVTVILGDVAVQ